MVTGGREVSWADQTILENDNLNTSNMYTVNDGMVYIELKYGNLLAICITGSLGS